MSSTAHFDNIETSKYISYSLAQAGANPARPVCRLRPCARSTQQSSPLPHPNQQAGPPAAGLLRAPQQLSARSTIRAGAARRLLIHIHPHRTHEPAKGKTLGQIGQERRRLKACCRRWSYCASVPGQCGRPSNMPMLPGAPIHCAARCQPTRPRRVSHSALASPSAQQTAVAAGRGSSTACTGCTRHPKAARIHHPPCSTPGLAKAAPLASHAKGSACSPPRHEAQHTRCPSRQAPEQAGSARIAQPNSAAPPSTGAAPRSPAHPHAGHRREAPCGGAPRRPLPVPLPLPAALPACPRLLSSKKPKSSPAPYTCTRTQEVNTRQRHF